MVRDEIQDEGDQTGKRSNIKSHRTIAYRSWFRCGPEVLVKCFSLVFLGIACMLACFVCFYAYLVPIEPVQNDVSRCAVSAHGCGCRVSCLWLLAWPVCNSGGCLSNMYMFRCWIVARSIWQAWNLAKESQIRLEKTEKISSAVN